MYINVYKNISWQAHIVGMLETINWAYFEQAMWFQKIQMFKTKTAAALLTKQEVKWKVKTLAVTEE